MAFNDKIRKDVQVEYVRERSEVILSVYLFSNLMLLEPEHQMFSNKYKLSAVCALLPNLIDSTLSPFYLLSMFWNLSRPPGTKSAIILKPFEEPQVFHSEIFLQLIHQKLLDRSWNSVQADNGFSLRADRVSDAIHFFGLSVRYWAGTLLNSFSSFVDSIIFFGPADQGA